MTLPTIWHVPDELWEIILPLLDEFDPPRRRGRSRLPPRPLLEAIIFRLRTGCQWNHLPKAFPDDSTVHRTFQHWIRIGLFPRIWAALTAACEERGGLDWTWQAADGAMGKARFGGDLLGPNPTDRGKGGANAAFWLRLMGDPSR